MSNEIVSPRIIIQNHTKRTFNPSIVDVGETEYRVPFHSHDVG